MGNKIVQFKLSAKRLWNILPNIDWRRLLTIYPILKKAFRRFVFPVGSTAPVISGKSLKTTAACPPVSIDDLYDPRKNADRRANSI